MSSRIRITGVSWLLVRCLVCIDTLVSVFMRRRATVLGMSKDYVYNVMRLTDGSNKRSKEDALIRRNGRSDAEKGQGDERGHIFRRQRVQWTEPCEYRLAISALGHPV